MSLQFEIVAFLAAGSFDLGYNFVLEYVRTFALTKGRKTQQCAHDSSSSPSPCLP